MFVIGDTRQVIRHTQQLVLNPFHGFARRLRNVLDPSLTETVKEFALLDGAFIVDTDGAIRSAGTYLNPKSKMVLAFCYAFSTAGAYVVGRSAADALFLARAGTAWLPLMCFLSACTVELLAVVFLHFATGRSLKQVILLTIILKAAHGGGGRGMANTTSCNPQTTHRARWTAASRAGTTQSNLTGMKLQKNV